MNEMNTIQCFRAKKKRYSGAHSRVATLIQPSFQKTKNKKGPYSFPFSPSAQYHSIRRALLSKERYAGRFLCLFANPLWSFLHKWQLHYSNTLSTPSKEGRKGEREPLIARLPPHPQHNKKAQCPTTSFRSSPPQASLWINVWRRLLSGLSPRYSHSPSTLIPLEKRSS